MSEDVHEEVPVSFEDHEKLARAMLDVAGPGVDQMKAAMWTIIADVPDGIDIALVLALAMGRLTSLEERAAKSEAVPSPPGKRHTQGCREPLRRLQHPHLREAS